MKRILFLIMLIALPVHASNPSDIAEMLYRCGEVMYHGGTFVTRLGTLGPAGTIFWQNRNVLYQKIEAISFDEDDKEIKQVAYTHSSKQRRDARLRYEGIIVGLMTHVFTDPIFSVPFSAQLAPYRLRKADSIFVALEQNLLPAACYAESKKAVDYYMPTANIATRISGALVGALFGARFFVSTGASPERLALAAYMYHCSADTSNKYMHKPVVGTITHAFAESARIVPVMQAVGGMIDTRPGFLTLHPTYEIDEEVDRPTELLHAVTPVIIHTSISIGFDFALNAASSTALGKDMDRAINTQLYPILGQEGTEDAKKLATGLAKAGLTVAAIQGAKAMTKDGCTVM